MREENGCENAGTKEAFFDLKMSVMVSPSPLRVMPGTGYDPYGLLVFHFSIFKKTVLKVNINCQKCQRGLLQAVTKLTGINEISVDGEKGTLTVIGDADPVCIVKQIRKMGKLAEIITVGPPKPPPEAKKPKSPKPALPPCCNDCQLVAIGFVPYDILRRFSVCIQVLFIYMSFNFVYPCTPQKIVLRVNIHCQRCKKEVLRAVTKLTGIDQVSVDGDKGTLTVVGDVDPVCVIKQVRKMGKVAEIISVGPPNPPECPPHPCRLPPCCNDCQLVAVSFSTPNDGRLCSIL
ncbi:hypothetical protein L1049_019996 [Liquidambar formosana]|uniref:HMA domain-containing protein n=1 Tax=Liquidambar formosana TaxID=63359 RepID=A0AAP0X6Z7_LIQFO